MAKKTQEEKMAEMQKTILLLQGEVERLSSPPYLSGTILDIGKETARVSIDNSGIYEIPFNDELKKKTEKGSRVILNPMSKSFVGNSEFETPWGEVATVDEVLEDRLRIQSKGEPYLIFNSLEDVKSGDEIMLDPSKAIAIEKLSRKKTKYVLEEVPVAPWTNIGGLEEVITKIKHEIEEPFVHREIFEKYGRKPAKGILLYGPPGCGKTMVAKSIAYNLAQLVNGKNRNYSKGTNGHFIKINGPEILDKWVGNPEANIRRIYQAARESASENGSPVIVFVDEAEAILKKRGTGISSDVYDSIVPQFLAEMDGLNGQYNVITILATNREDIIDPAILRDGRIDRRIMVPRPNKEDASKIFQIYLADKPIQTKMFNLGKANTRKISEKLVEGIYDNKNTAYAVVHPDKGILGKFYYRHLMSGAMIKGIVDRASTYAIQREINGARREKGISQGDLEKSIYEGIRDHAGFAQALVKEDWEDVFDGQGRQYQEACAQGYLVLESMLKNPTKLKEVKK